MSHGADNTSADTDTVDLEESLEVLLGEQVTEEGRVESIGGGAAESYNADEIEGESSGVEWNRRLLEHGLVESLITDEDFGLDRVALVQGVGMFDNLVSTGFLCDVGHLVQWSKDVVVLDVEAQVRLENGMLQKRQKPRGNFSFLSPTGMHDLQTISHMLLVRTFWDRVISLDGPPRGEQTRE